LTIYNVRFYCRWSRGNMAKSTDLVQGTLDLLILKTIALEPKHGWGIAKRIQQVSREVLQVQQGSLYPALHRLEQQGWIQATWKETETGRPAKFYALTADGRKHLEKELEQWDRLSSAVNLVIAEV
jgi:PadR family transcriptional regulator PadR